MTTNNAVNVGLSGSTGTVNFVGSTTPTITTPKIVTSILDTNANTLLGITATGSAVNYINVTNSIATVSPTISAAGSDSNLSVIINSKGTGGVIIQGITNGGNAAAGYVGELISSASGAVSISTITATDMTSVSLTAGDWDVWGNLVVSSSGTVISQVAGWTSITSATLPNVSFTSGITVALGTIAQFQGAVPYARYSFSTTTSVYISAYTTFASGTATCIGRIYARRVR